MRTSLLFATNGLGSFKKENANPIEQYLDKPSFDTWNAIAHLIISGKGRMITIWQAVIKIDRTFPMSGRSTDSQGNVIKEWAKIPSPDVVKEAISTVTIASQLSMN